MIRSRNLLDTPDLDPPMGDLFSFRTLSECRSLWTAPLPHEFGAPPKRIIHARAFTPTGKATIDRIGFRNAPGYHKCGSHQELDWIVDLRILSLDHPEAEWRELRCLRDLSPLAEDAVQWIDLDGLATYGLLLEIRRCGIDGWWTPWNLASEAFIVEGKLHHPIAPRNESLIEPTACSLGALPDGVRASVENGQLRYRSSFMDVGFWLSRAGFSHLGIDQQGEGNTSENLLVSGPGSFHQGPMLSPCGSIPVADPAVRFRFTGEVEIDGNRIRYRLANRRCGIAYDLQWTVLPQSLRFDCQRSLRQPLRAWRSAAWRIAFQPSTAATHVMAQCIQEGQSGSFASPAILHAPAHGSFALASEQAALARAEVFRPRDRIELELKCGETAAPTSDWLLPTGNAKASWAFTLALPADRLRPNAPAVVKAAYRRAAFTGLSFRPDTGTLSNNGASMHCPISMDTWSNQCVRMGNLLPELPASQLLQQSLERWLLGGPGYAAGNLKQDGEIHSGEDEYLMTGTAALLGLADFVDRLAPPAWIEAYAEAIVGKLDEMLARDLDGDGLIESPYRTGTSGSRQWSTCWYDVISYGWKDAFSNALLYEALGRFEHAAAKGPLHARRKTLRDWRERIRRAYFPCFFNPETGWLAGWLCREGKRHDHAFLACNGAAVAAGLVEPDAALDALRRLLDESRRVGMPSARLGLPGNLRPIPDEDLSDIIQGYPFGYYQNGGRTHAQARHFLRGLYAVGLTDEADALLEELAQGLADAAVFGGCKSGLDWRYWDDRPCGYEGLLTDQFGVIGLILERYATA